MLIQLLFINPLLYLMVVVAILLGFGTHEYFHAWAAYSLGDPTAKNSGRLTPNPLVHFDPLGTLLIFIMGIGWGKPVPFNPYNLRNQRWGPSLVGLAGPASNFLNALIVGLLMRFLNLSDPSLITFFSIFIWINLTLGVFNLLPFPPLDGSHIFLNILPVSLENFKATLQANPFLIILAFLFMFYIGFPFVCRPLFGLITGMPSPF